MDDQERLRQWTEQRFALEDEIENLDLEIKRAEYAAVDASESGRWVTYIGECYQKQQGLFFDLGKVTARIEDLEERIREQAEQERERANTNRWQETPESREDHLDWLRPVLDAPEPEEIHDRDVRNPQREGEERMLEEMHRNDREPEDYLDWYTARDR
ncbi:hypothetical protein [Roseibium aggregatum]|uniref:Uncharacterized protein n=1 Tax=Roseibium aggregatum TaxID=187304 RepID=A0A926P457_9HYPH|nr:hypothetical protein [Roseibium aggregatum]MBD1549530.1 hypothetical protein [Roseibium aggregatum]